MTNSGEIGHRIPTIFSYNTVTLPININDTAMYLSDAADVTT